MKPKITIHNYANNHIEVMIGNLLIVPTSVELINRTDDFGDQPRMVLEFPIDTLEVITKEYE